MYSPAVNISPKVAKPKDIVTRDLGITEFTSRDESIGSSIDHGFEQPAIGNMSGLSPLPVPNLLLEDKIPSDGGRSWSAEET